MREANLAVDDSEFDSMGIAELISLAREAGLRDLEELTCHGNGAVVQVELDSRYDEERLSELDCVDHWTHVTESEGRHVYVVAFTAPNLSEDLQNQADDLVGTCDPEIGERGGTVSLVGPQEAISGTIDEYERSGVSPDLRKLGGYEGGTKPLDELTDRQREIVQLAYDQGYYEVPRQISTDELADELGLDPSTVAEHLQRAERNLLGDLL